MPGLVSQFWSPAGRLGDSFWDMVRSAVRAPGRVPGLVSQFWSPAGRSGDSFWDMVRGAGATAHRSPVRPGNSFRLEGATS